MIGLPVGRDLTMALLDVLDELSPSDRMRILAHAEPREFTPDELIIDECIENRTIHFIMDGEVCVGTKAPTMADADRFIVLATLSVGSVIGEMTFLTHGTTSARCTAVGPVSTLALDHRQLTELIQTEPALAARFYRSVAITLARRLITSNEHAAQVSWSID